eukprot:759727-Hanusia_phi.AAC.3
MLWRCNLSRSSLLRVPGHDIRSLAALPCYKIRSPSSACRSFFPRALLPVPRRASDDAVGGVRRLEGGAGAGAGAGGSRLLMSKPPDNLWHDRTFLGAAAAMSLAVSSSNFLVLFPINDWFTAGTLTYPVTFLITDVCNKFLGKAAADRVVMSGFALAMPISYFLSGPRIAIASGTAYLTSQLLDVRIFDRLRHRAWWVAPLVSTFVGSAVDSSLFVTIAFLGEPVPWVTWGIGDFGMKVCMALLMLVPFKAITGSVVQRSRRSSWHQPLGRSLGKGVGNLLAEMIRFGGRLSPAVPKASEGQAGRRRWVPGWLSGERSVPSRSFRMFNPTVEWQQVEDDHVLPPGLEIRMDVTSGSRYARLPPQVRWKRREEGGGRRW